MPSRPVQLTIKTFVKWQQDECLEMGAALSYYALFSLFPIVLVVASVLGFLLGPDTDVFQKILTFTQTYLPPEAFSTVEETLLQINQQSLGAGIVGSLLSIFAASGVFGALTRAVEKIWHPPASRARPSSLISTTKNFLWRRLFAFGLVVSSAFLLLFSLLSNIAIRVVLNIVQNMNQAIDFINIDSLALASLLQTGSSFLLMAVVTLVLFRFLPSARIPWKDLWLGSLITALLLLGLQQLVGRNIIQIGGRYQSYGAIGGVMILMLWIYFSCQIFLLGCEMSYVYTYLFGTRRNHDLPI